MDTNYFYYQLIDRHPVIAIMMMAVLYLWLNGLTRKYLFREFKGDRSAVLPGAFFGLCGIIALTSIYSIFVNHYDSIAGRQSTVTYFHGHRYDVASQDTLLHSPLCGCRLQNKYMPSDGGDAAPDTAQKTNPIGDLLRKSMP